METATPGVKSTSDGWLNRYLQARHDEAATPFRAVALTPQLPRMLQGGAPALALSQIGQFGIRAGQASDLVGASFEAEYAAAADRVLNGTGREAFDAIKMLKIADPAKYQPDNGADYPRGPFGQALKQIAQLTKSNVGLEVAFADLGGRVHRLSQLTQRPAHRTERVVRLRPQEVRELTPRGSARLEEQIGKKRPGLVALEPA